MERSGMTLPHVTPSRFSGEAYTTLLWRKNWLFSASPKGAKASSIIYSKIETAKMNMLKTFEYLKHIFEVMPNTTPDMYVSLLPWSETLPVTCKIDSQKAE
jgi:hypothetical protein